MLCQSFKKVLFSAVFFNLLTSTFSCFPEEVEVREQQIQTYHEWACFSQLPFYNILGNCPKPLM